MTRKIEPQLGSVGVRTPSTRAESPAGNSTALPAQQQSAEPAYVAPRSFDPAPPSCVAPPWTGLQRAPLARRHTVALVALLAVAAAALGVAVSQLYQGQNRAGPEPRQIYQEQDHPRLPEPHSYTGKASRELPTQPDSNASAVPLFDSTALANNTARLSAQGDDARTAHAAPQTTQAATQTATRKTAPLFVPPQRLHPAQHSATTVASAEPVRSAAESTGVSRAKARAATEALTRDAITPLPPDAARIDPTQPPVAYGGRPMPSTSSAVSRLPVATTPSAALPSAVEATAALTAKAVALPRP